MMIIVFREELRTFIIRAVDLLSVNAFHRRPAAIYTGINQSISAVAFYPPTKTFYIADDDKKVISSYNITGWDKPMEFIDDIITGVGHVSSLVLDPGNGDLYWSDAENNTISVWNADDSSQRTLLSNLQSPRNLILDHRNRLLFWINDGPNTNRTLERASVNGTHLQTCHHGSELITHSSKERKLYWFDTPDGGTTGAYRIGEDHVINCQKSSGHKIGINGARNFAVKENTIQWTAGKWFYGRLLGDWTDQTFQSYTLGPSVAFRIYSKFSNNQRSDCPDGWQKYEGSCYQFVSTPKNWVAASKNCVANSPFQYGHLATIHSDMENRFITYIVMERRRERAWIGLNDRSEEGVFTWQAHHQEPFLSQKAFWKLGEPNNGGERLSQEEDCVEINRGGLGLWNDCKCRKPLPFICEVELFNMEKGGRGNKAGLPKADPRFL